MAERDRILRIIRDNQGALAQLGVLHVAVFGSVARNDDHPGSDVDLLVDVDPRKVKSIFALGRIQARLETLVGRPVDLTRHDRLRSHVAVEAERDAVHAF